MMITNDKLHRSTLYPPEELYLQLGGSVALAATTSHDRNITMISSKWAQLNIALKWAHLR